MEAYINQAACRGTYPDALSEASATMKSRRFLVAKLFSARETVRLMVAPTGFGKSLLAAQYASLVFSFWHVFWFDCQDVRFLRALAEGTLSQLVLARDNEAALVVFDDVPCLSKTQANAFKQAIDNLRALNCEILICATPVCAKSFTTDTTYNVVLTYKQLLVRSAELNDAHAHTPACSHTHSRSAHQALFSSISARIPLVAWGNNQSVSALIRGFALDELPEHDMLAGLMLFGATRIHKHVAQNWSPILTANSTASSAHALGSFSSDVHTTDAHTLGSLALSAGAPDVHAPSIFTQRLDTLCEHYPYFSFDEASNCYETLACEDEFFEQMLLSFFTETVSFLPNNEADEYAKLFVQAMLASHNVWRAYTAASVALTRPARVHLASVLAPLFSLCLSVNEFSRFSHSVAGAQACLDNKLSACEQLAKVLACEGAGSISEEEMQNFVTQSLLSTSALAKQATEQESLLEMVQKSVAVLLDSNAQQEHIVHALEQVCEFLNTQPIGSTDACNTDELLVHELCQWQCALVVIVVLCWFAHTRAGNTENAVASLLIKALECARNLTLPEMLENERASAQACFNQSTCEITAYTQISNNEASALHYHVIPVPQLHVNMWGSFSATIGAHTIDARSFKRKKSIVLLAILAAEKGRGFNRDYLVELLWPESALSCARRNFHAVWSDLRHGLCLGDGTCPYLVRLGGSYQLESTLVQSDIQDVQKWCSFLHQSTCEQEQLNEAFSYITEHCSGSLLPGVPENDHIAHYSQALNEQVNDALIAAANTLLNRGDIPFALRYAKEAMRRAPEREDACELVMQSQMRLGQSVSAINTFLGCQRILSEQLGVDPSPAIYALYEQALGVAH